MLKPANMFEVKLTQRAIIDIEMFLTGYEDSFLQLYNNSGIWSEKLIVDLYAQSARELRDKILHTTEEKLRENKVLGRKKHDSMFEISFHVGARLITILYSEKEQYMRQVEYVFIDRKPIIF